MIANIPQASTRDGTARVARRTILSLAAGSLVPRAAKAQSNPSIVKDVPTIMRNYGRNTGSPEWEKPAKLQDIWLLYNRHEAAPNIGERYEFRFIAWPSLTGITMDWVLNPKVGTDERARTAFGLLQAAVVSDDGSMRGRIQTLVNRLFESTPGNTVQLGRLKWTEQMDLEAYHAQRVHSAPVVTDTTLTPLDPLLGALGSFNFYAIPIGKATRQPGGTIKVDITDFDFYVLDSFDFNGDQQLGFWGLPDIISKTPVAGALRVSNGLYQEFRNSPASNGKGGDFLVMTDTRRVHLPLSFSFTPPASISGTWASTDAKHRFKLAISGTSVEWTEVGPETGISITRTLQATKQGEQWRIERPNNESEVLKMLGYQDLTLQQAIISAGPHPSYLVIRPQENQLAGKWSGIRVQKTAQGKFKNLMQPEDPANAISDYALTRA